MDITVLIRLDSKGNAWAVTEQEGTSLDDIATCDSPFRDFAVIVRADPPPAKIQIMAMVDVPPDIPGAVTVR